MDSLVDRKIIEREYKERLQYERQRYAAEARRAPHIQPEPSRLVKGIGQTLAAISQKLTLNLQPAQANPAF